MAVAVGVALMVLLAGCTGAGRGDAVAVGGAFRFVAPGGQTTITYDGADRRAVGAISGESLLREGATVGLADYPDQVVVLNVWGSWCTPCREEAPDLQFVADQTGAAVLGVAVRDNRQGAADFVRDRGLRFDSIVDPPGRVLAGLSGYPRNSVPSTLVLDRQHRVAAVFLTQIRIPELIPLVQRLQAEPPG